MDINQKYCQFCHLINRNGFIITKIMSSQIRRFRLKFISIVQVGFKKKREMKFDLM
jgi:hypothetical protein